MSTFGHQFQLIFEYLPQGILILDTSASVQYCNRQALEMLQQTQQDVLQSAFTKFLIPESAQVFESHFQQTLAGGVSPYFELVTGYQVAGSSGWWQVHVTYVRSDDHSPFVFAVIEDITNKRKGEEKLIREREIALRATKTKSAFLANVSHEIRTPIHTIMGMSEMLLDTELDVEQREYAGQIQFSADVLLSLVNDVLDLSKIEAGKLSLEIIEFDLYTVIEDAADMVSQEAHKKGLELILDFDERVPVLVQGDPLRIRQILVNFLSNALKFTHHGSIAVRVEWVETTSQKTTVRIAVEDSGIGIQEKKLDNLFQAFRQIDSSTTRKFGGTGLGLSISKNLIRMMRGKIGVRSKPGKGSTFWVLVPLGHSQRAVELVQPLTDLYNKKALIIDDSQEHSAVVSKYLSRWGMQTTWERDGMRAIETMRRAALTDQPFELVLIDLLLDDMDGWQVAGNINADTTINSTRLILMVPNGKLGADAKMKRLGWFDDYITKPIRLRTLHSKLQTVLRKDLDLSPLDQNAHPVDQSPNQDSNFPPQVTGTALLAEDHEVNQELFRTILEHCGLKVVTALNGQEAVELAAGQSFDIVFMDVQMPIMNGYSASQKIKQQYPELPIIGVTANAMQGEREKCIKAGMDDYLPKPFKARDVYPYIRKYLTESVFFNGEAANSYRKINEKSLQYEAALETFLGKKDVLDRVLRMFCQRGEQQLDEIQGSLNDGNFDNARILSHGMKGGAAHLEAKRLSSLAAELEHSCIDGHKNAAQQQLKQLRVEFQHFVAEANALL